MQAPGSEAGSQAAVAPATALAAAPSALRRPRAASISLRDGEHSPRRVVSQPHGIDPWGVWIRGCGRTARGFGPGAIAGRVNTGFEGRAGALYLYYRRCVHTCQKDRSPDPVVQLYAAQLRSVSRAGDGSRCC